MLRDAKGHLQRIYTAADQIYRRGNPKPRTTSTVNDIIIIQACCARILTHLLGRAAYLAVIAKTTHSLAGAICADSIVHDHSLAKSPKHLASRAFKVPKEGCGDPGPEGLPQERDSRRIRRGYITSIHRPERFCRGETLSQ